MIFLLSTLFCLLMTLQRTTGFAFQYTGCRNGVSLQMADAVSTLEAIDVKEADDLSLDALDTSEVKTKLLDLLPRMTGSPDEFRAVEQYVNLLEERYTPIQTLDFLNLAMSGEWQLLFSTKLSGGPRANFRLRELYQRVETNSSNPFEGTVSNEVTWDLAEDGENFAASGTFTVLSQYEINQGSRMIINLEDSLLRLAKGSAVPKDVENLVGLLNRAMPNEMFDPDEHAMDTTYLDGDLRIVRMSGPKFEGVRDIFMRRGSREINPVKEQ
jgi:hypothetical protein